MTVAKGGNSVLTSCSDTVESDTEPVRGGTMFHDSEKGEVGQEWQLVMVVVKGKSR